MATDKKYQRKIIESGVRPFVPSGYRAAAQAAGQSFGMLGRGLGVAAEASADAGERAHKEYIARRKTEITTIVRERQIKYSRDPKAFDAFMTDYEIDIVDDDPVVRNFARNAFSLARTQIYLRKQNKTDKIKIQNLKVKLEKKISSVYLATPNNTVAIPLLEKTLLNEIDSGKTGKDAFFEGLPPHLRETAKALVSQTASMHQIKAVDNSERGKDNLAVLALTNTNIGLLRKKSLSLKKKDSIKIDSLVKYAKELEANSKGILGENNSRRRLLYKQKISPFLKTLINEAENWNYKINNVKEISILQQNENTLLEDLHNPDNPDKGDILDRIARNYLELDARKKTSTIDWSKRRKSLLIPTLKNWIDTQDTDSRKNLLLKIKEWSFSGKPLPVGIPYLSSPNWEEQAKKEKYNNLLKIGKNLTLPLAVDERKSIAEELKSYVNSKMAIGPTKNLTLETKGITSLLSQGISRDGVISRDLIISERLREIIGEDEIFTIEHFKKIQAYGNEIANKAKKIDKNSTIPQSIINSLSKFRQTHLTPLRLTHESLANPNSTGNSTPSSVQDYMRTVIVNEAKKKEITLPEGISLRSIIEDKSGVQFAKALIHWKESNKRAYELEPPITEADFYDVRTNELEISDNNTSFYNFLMGVQRKENIVGTKLQNLFSNIPRLLSVNKEGGLNLFKIAWKLYNDLGYPHGEMNYVPSSSENRSIFKVFNKLNSIYSIDTNTGPSLDMPEDSVIREALDMLLPKIGDSDEQEIKQNREKAKTYLEGNTLFKDMAASMSKVLGPVNTLYDVAITGGASGTRKIFRKMASKGSWLGSLKGWLSVDIKEEDLKKAFENKKVLNIFKHHYTQIATINTGMEQQDIMANALRTMFRDGYALTENSEFNQMPGYEGKFILQRFPFESMMQVWEQGGSGAWLNIGVRKHLMTDLYGHFTKMGKEGIARSGRSVTSEVLQGAYGENELSFTPILTGEGKIGYMVKRHFSGKYGNEVQTIATKKNPWVPDYTKTPAYKLYKQMMLSEKREEYTYDEPRDQQYDNRLYNQLYPIMGALALDHSAVPLQQRHLNGIVKRIIGKTLITGKLIQGSIKSSPTYRAISDMIDSATMGEIKLY